MTKKDKLKLHSIALKYNVRDEIAKLIVESPFLFMKETIINLNLDELEKTNFYHKKLGKFYLKKEILKHINKYKNDKKK